MYNVQCTNMCNGGCSDIELGTGEFETFSRRLWSLPELWRSKLFSSVEDNTCNRFLPSSAAYGMTEASPTASQSVKGSGKYVSVGAPIPNTEMKVVHPENRSSLAARQTGEICMRGPQVREREIEWVSEGGREWERERDGETKRERELSGFAAFHT